jgi:hypothetical protein
MKQSHNGFEKPWQFIVAFKSFDTKADWFVDESLINLKIHQRTIHTVNGGSPLLYFDGATMLSYLHPSKASEAVFCHRNPKPASCEAGQGFDPERENLPLSSLEVKPSSLGEKAGRGVFAKVDIPQLSYIGLERLIHMVYMHPSAHDVISSMRAHRFHDFNEPEDLEVYSHAYGHWFSHHVSTDLPWHDECSFFR